MALSHPTATEMRATVEIEIDDVTIDIVTRTDEITIDQAQVPTIQI